MDVLGEVARQTGIAVQGAEALQQRVSIRFEGLALREGLESPAMEEPGTTIAIPEREPESGVDPEGRLHAALV